MLGKLFDLLPSLGVGMLGGVLSWFATDWVTKPIAAFRTLRESVIEELHFFANVYDGSPPHIREEASRHIRRLGSEAHKLNESSNFSIALVPVVATSRPWPRLGGAGGLLELSTRTSGRVTCIDARSHRARDGIAPFTH